MLALGFLGPKSVGIPAHPQVVKICGLHGHGASLGFPFFLETPPVPQGFLYFPRWVEFSSPHFQQGGIPGRAWALCRSPGQLLVLGEPSRTSCPCGHQRPVLASEVCWLLLVSLGPRLTVYHCSSHISSFLAPEDFLFFPSSSIMYLIILDCILSSISVHLEPGVVVVRPVCVYHDLLCRVFPSRVTNKISLWFYFCFTFGRFWYQGYALFIKLIRECFSFLYSLEHFQ